MPITHRIQAASFSVTQVADFLKKNGIPVKKVTPYSNEEDASVEINSLVHVQVGFGYLVVNYWINKRKNAMSMGEMRTSLGKELLDDVKKALKK